MRTGLKRLDQQATPTRNGALEDNALMLKARNGSEDAFYEIVSRYKNPMVNYLYRLLGNYDLAVDLSQDVFLKVFRNMERYDGNLKFSTWIYKIATNTAIDEMRRRKRRPALVLESETLRDGEEDSRSHVAEAEDSGNPEEALLSGETARRLDAAINSLEPQQKQIFILKEIAHMPLEEICKVTGIKVGTLKSKLFRARGFLKERLLPYFRGGEVV